MGNMRVRAGASADRSRIVALDSVAKSDSGRVGFIDRALNTETCLVVEFEREVVAYGVLEYTFYEYGFVSLVYVSESHRRRGAGHALMEALAAACRTPKLFTSTNQSNRPMQKLLERLGYVRSGIIHNLDPGDPELVYVLDRSAKG